MSEILIFSAFESLWRLIAVSLLNPNSKSEFRCGVVQVVAGNRLPNEIKEVIMLKRYRVGIVGCGHISRTHMHAYRTVFATDVVTAAEVVEDRRQAFSEEYRIATLYNDYREMLDNEDLDIISVCTLADSHCEITVAAAERGIHVLCEKPMALDLEEADRMIDACKQAGVKLAIDHHRRGDARYHFAQQLIADGAIGELQAIIAEGATAGVGLMETATHLYDSIRIFGGDVDWVFAHITTNGDDISVVRDM